MTSPPPAGPPRRPGPPGGPGPGQEDPYGRRPPGPGGPVPGPRRGGGTGAYAAPAPAPPQKGVLGALLDFDFNHLVTPKLIKLLYVLALLLVSLSAFTVLALGLWIFQLRNGWLVGMLVIISS